MSMSTGMTEVHLMRRKKSPPGVCLEAQVKLSHEKDDRQDDD